MSKHLYLASQSTRRVELLRQIGLAPVILPLRHATTRADIDERPLSGEKAYDYVHRLATMKIEAGLNAVASRRLPAMPVVAADTTVVVDDEILGKPVDASDAAAMLRRYSGRSHIVATGVGVAYMNRVEIAVSESEVWFKELDQADIKAYVDTMEPYDKAGGYAIQGRAAVFVKRIAGSYTGIMGLPLFETSELLKSVGFDVLQSNRI